MIKERGEYRMAYPGSAAKYIQRVSVMNCVERESVRESARTIGKRMVKREGYSAVSIGLEVRRCADEVLSDSRLFRDLGVSDDGAGEVAMICALIQFGCENGDLLKSRSVA